jgi:PEP-CTERM motif-containing protein
MNNNISGQIARKLAGFAIAALVMFGVFAITPATAKADSGQVQASADYTNVSLAAESDIWFWLSPTAQNDLDAAQKALKAGNYTAEINDLNAVIKILDLGKPLAQISTAAPEPSTMLLIACGLLGLGLFARRKANA